MSNPSRLSVKLLNQDAADFITITNLGKSSYIRRIHKFGANDDIPGGFEDIWNEEGDYPFPTTAEPLRVQAGGNANDTLTGTGARTIEVTFLDENWNEVTETIELE